MNPMNLMNLMSGLGNMRKLEEQMAASKEALEKETFEGKAGGGMVTVTVNGAMHVLRCQIEPSLFASGDREMVEELVVSATNEAQAQAREFAANFSRKMITEHFNMPELEGLLGNFFRR